MKQLFLFLFIFYSITIKATPPLEQKFKYINIKFKNVNGHVFMNGNSYGGEFKTGAITFGGVTIIPVKPDKILEHPSLFFSHFQSVEVYNFTTKNWIKASVIPADLVMVTNRSISVAHTGGIQLQMKKSEFFIGVGPNFHFEEFNGTPYVGIALKIRFKINK